MNEVALVTGGAKGIGEAVVRKLCADGFSVSIIYNSSEQRAISLCSELALAGYNVCAVKCDVSDSNEVRKAFRITEEKLGSVSVLINNAGVSLWGLFDETTDSQWDDIIAINLSGTFYFCREAVKSMLKNKYGRIINISSVWGQVGASCEAAYSASKAGVIGLTKAMAKEYALSGITVNCICPGVVDTDMMNRFSAEEKEIIADDIPMGRMGTPAEIASAVSFFASHNSAYITGQVLGVNGGTV